MHGFRHRENERVTEVGDWIEGARRRRFWPYPTHKDSGVEWLGNIPAHWEVERLKHLASLNDETLGESTDPGLEMNYVDIGSVDAIKGITWSEAIVFENAPSRARRVVRGGDVIASTVRTYLRAIAAIDVPDSNLIVSTGFAVIRPRQLQSSFASYALRAPHFVERVVANSVGVSYPAINASSLACFEIPYPGVDEQRTIAEFLDRETAKIDGLVARKGRLIELLQEKRNALITRAVTRGLDPKVPMKESGVEWLGEIPAHWEVKRLKWAIMFQRGHDLPSHEREEGEVPIVSSSGVSSTHCRAAASAPGIVTGRYGTIGGFYLIVDDYWPLNTTLYSIDLRKNDPRFLWYMLVNLSPLFTVNARKSAVPGVDRKDIHPLATAIPELPEQQAIAALLDRETARIDGLIAKIRRAMDLLNEARTAMVSAAVTGKIDVREET